MANSTKLTDLTEFTGNLSSNDLFLVAAADSNNNYESYKLQYSNLSANIYADVMKHLNNLISEISSSIMKQLSGEPSLTAITSNSAYVSSYPTKLVGLSAIYDLAIETLSCQPRWH